mgnify:CR=1 FL=1
MFSSVCVNFVPIVYIMHVSYPGNQIFWIISLLPIVLPFFIFFPQKLFFLVCYIPPSPAMKSLQNICPVSNFTLLKI